MYKLLQCKLVKYRNIAHVNCAATDSYRNEMEVLLYCTVYCTVVKGRDKRGENQTHFKSLS
jgi:hypothetical protein